MASLGCFLEFLLERRVLLMGQTRASGWAWAGVGNDTLFWMMGGGASPGWGEGGGPGLPPFLPLSSAISQAHHDHPDQPTASCGGSRAHRARQNPSAKLLRPVSGEGRRVPIKPGSPVPRPSARPPRGTSPVDTHLGDKDGA